MLKINSVNKSSSERLNKQRISLTNPNLALFFIWQNQIIIQNSAISSIVLTFTLNWKASLE